MRFLSILFFSLFLFSFVFAGVSSSTETYFYINDEASESIADSSIQEDSYADDSWIIILALLLIFVVLYILVRMKKKRALGLKNKSRKSVKKTSKKK